MGFGPPVAIEPECGGHLHHRSARACAAFQRHDEGDQRSERDIQFLAHCLVWPRGEIDRAGKAGIFEHRQALLGSDLAHGQRGFAPAFGQQQRSWRAGRIVGQGDSEVQWIDNDELGFLHRAGHTPARQIALALAAGGTHLGRAFGLLVLLAHFLKAHLQPLVPLDLPAQDYAVLMGGVNIARGNVRPGKLLAIDAGDVRAGHGLTGEPTRDPSFDCPALWIAPPARDHAVAEGFLVVDPASVIATHANQALLAEAHQLLGPDEVREWVDGLKTRAPALVEAVHPDPLSLPALTRTLRALLADGIALSHPQPLFTSLALALQKTTDFDAVIDAVRTDLSARIVARIASPDETLKVVTLDAGLEAAILGGMVDPATGQPLIEPDCGAMILREINAVADAERGAIALIVQPPARRALAALLKTRAPRCLVLSIAELPASQPIAVVGVIGAPADAPALAAPEGIAA